VDPDQRLRPQSALIRQSSWSGLSESSSHESLTGPLVKSSSLSSVRTLSDSKNELPAPPLPGGSEPLTLPPLSSEVKPSKKTLLHDSGTNGCGDAGSRKPPLGRRDTSTPPPAPLGGLVVPRSQVCLSNFYKECAESAESEPDCSCQPAERDGRSVFTCLRCEQVSTALFS